MVRAIITIKNKGKTMATKLKAPKMVYISGEEMTREVMRMIRESWVAPHVDTSAWEEYDLSCKARDESKDKVLDDAIEAGARIGAIFKEPTITPTQDQADAMGLSKAWGSPNGKMRRAWNGYTISRDTIMIKGIKLGYDKPVFFERQAVGGEYGAGYAHVGKGKSVTMFYPEDGSEPVKVDERELKDSRNAVVTYHNPIDSVSNLAHHFYSRCLEAGIKPYVTTKKTVFKWQEPFWEVMQNIFNAEYKSKFVKAGIFKEGEELGHLISDDATMKLIRWTEGGFGMACHNYDGDMLTDEMSQVHKSPGFISSNLIGVATDGSAIKEFEASHGTVADQYQAFLKGEETSLNPLGLVCALTNAIKHSAALAAERNELNATEKDALTHYADAMYDSLCEAMVEGKGTRDLCGPSGLTTEQFIAYVGEKLNAKLG